MRRNSLAALVAIALAAGCSHQQAVYVDLDAAVKADSAASVKTFAAISTDAEAQLKKKGILVGYPPVKKSPPMSGSLPAIPGETINGPSTTAYAQAEAAVAANRAKAYRELERHLESVYLAEVVGKEQELIAALGPEAKKRDEVLLGKFQSAFQDYANKRAALAARLALLVGWPDIKRTQDVTAGINPAAAKRITEANAIRTKLDVLDQRFDLDVNQLVTANTKASDQSLTQIRAAIAVERANAFTRAKDDATAQVRALEASAGPSVADIGTLELPAVPAQSTHTDSPTVVLSPPVIDGAVVDKLGNQRRDRIIEELTIWLAINGYRQAKTPSDGPDRTAEFLKWRNTHRPGP